MANEQKEALSGFSPEEEEWIKQQRARKKKRSQKGREEESDSLNINSLMDILVVLLVFLMKSYGDQPIQVTGDDLKVPQSTTQLPPEDMTTITVTQKSVLVNNTKAVDVKEGSVDKSQKKGGESSLYIQPLYDELTATVKKRKKEAKVLNEQYEPVVTIIADQSTPYRLVTEVMYTAGQAELSKFKFAVIKSERSRVAPSGN
ncbi:MAG: ExbD/TolR family protein [Myxococcota bacterium]